MANVWFGPARSSEPPGRPLVLAPIVGFRDFWAPRRFRFIRMMPPCSTPDRRRGLAFQTSDVDGADQPQQDRSASQQAARAAQQASSAVATPAGAAARADVPDMSTEPAMRYFFMHILHSAGSVRRRDPPRFDCQTWPVSQLNFRFSPTGAEKKWVCCSACVWRRRRGCLHLAAGPQWRKSRILLRRGQRTSEFVRSRGSD